MAIIKGLVRNITRTQAFDGGDLGAVHTQANTFIEGLEADADKTYTVTIAAAYSTPANVHVVVVVYSYMEDVPPAEL